MSPTVKQSAWLALVFYAISFYFLTIAVPVTADGGAWIVGSISWHIVVPTFAIGSAFAGYGFYTDLHG